jgi:hypothetical protein
MLQHQGFSPWWGQFGWSCADALQCDTVFQLVVDNLNIILLVGSWQDRLTKWRFLAANLSSSVSETADDPSPAADFQCVGGTAHFDAQPGGFLHDSRYLFNLAPMSHTVSTFADYQTVWFLQAVVLLYWRYNPVWVLASSVGSCPAPLFSILIHQ